MRRSDPRRPPWRVLPLCALVCACGGEPQGGYPVFDGPELSLGREVWLANCQACHGSGLAGAPRLGDRTAWKPRIGQGIEVLTGHALNGFSGSSGTEMPARGGNPQLGDAAVKAAVRYMVRASE